MGAVKAVLRYLNSVGIWLGLTTSLSTAVIFYILLGDYLRFNPVYVIGYTALITFIIIFVIGWCLEESWPHLDWNQSVNQLTPKARPPDQQEASNLETPEEFLNRTLAERWPEIEEDTETRKSRRDN